MTIISSEDFIPLYDFKLPEVCDICDVMYVLRTGNIFVTWPSVFWDINFYPNDKSKPRDWLFLPIRYVQILFITH